MIKRIKKFFQRFKKIRPDIIVVLIAVVLILIVIDLIFFNNQPTTTTNTNNGTVQNLNQTDTGGSLVGIDKFPTSIDLLKNLPHIDKNFEASYFPLEQDVPPKIQVIEYNADGHQDFLNWVKQFTYSSTVEFIYVEQPPLETPGGE